MPVGDRLLERFLQARLHDMNMAALERLNRFFVHVKAADLKPCLGQRDRGRQADVAQPHDSNFHNFRTSFSKIFLHYTTFFAKFNVVFEFLPKCRYNEYCSDFIPKR